MTSTKKQRDNKGKSGIVGKNKRLLYISMVLLTCISLLIVYLLLPDILGYNKGASPQERQMNTLGEKIKSSETDLEEEQKKFSKLLNNYYQKTGEKLPELSAFGLTKSQKKTLEERIKSKKNFSTKALLNEILEKNNEISKISVLINKYQDLLPQSRTVKKGDSHYKIAKNFLINEKGAEKEQADLLVKRTALYDSLIPGFKVWNFYSGDEYGTFVTQGDADISPTELMRQEKEKLRDARDQAINEKEKSAVEVDRLKLEKIQSISQVNDLKHERQELKKEVRKLSSEKLEMNKTLNTLFYELDSKKNLVIKGMIKKRFLKQPKVSDTSPDSYKKEIDLRVEKSIVVIAKTFNLGS